MPDEKDAVGIICGVTVGGTIVDVGKGVGGVGFSVAVAIGLIGDCIGEAFDVQAATIKPSVISIQDNHFLSEVFIALNFCLCLLARAPNGRVLPRCEAQRSNVGCNRPWRPRHSLTEESGAPLSLLAN